MDKTTNRPLDRRNTPEDNRFFGLISNTFTLQNLTKLEQDSETAQLLTKCVIHVGKLLLVSVKPQLAKG